MSAVALVGVLSLIVFHVAIGWRMFRLSRAEPAA
jgi:hypothetical protein